MPGVITETDDSALLILFEDETTREAAFTALIKKYQERLYWHIRRIVVEHEDANDILQNVLVKLWHNLLSFKGNAQLYTWLYRIATNETLTWLEKEKKRKSIPLDSEEGFLQDTLIAQEGYDSKKIEWQLQRAIQSLPEKQRLVFSLRYYDEMPYEQMADVLKTSAGALKASYHHAVKKIETYLNISVDK